MAYNALNNLIDAYIYANGVQAITGQILNGVLKQMVSQLGSGYHLMGVAGPETVPASNDYAMAYFAATAGEYTDFGGITLAAGEVAVLLTSGNGSWSKQTIYNVPTGTADLENTANFITNAVTDLVNYYTKEEIDTTLADYPTLEALATALADYYTKTEIDEQKAETDAALADRYTKSETDAKLADYYKKTETYDKDEVDSIIAALSRQEYIVAWDGLAAPDVSAIPAGVTVTYSGATYTGTLAASASTVNKIYMVWNGTAYDMYGTSADGGYSWVPMGTTTVDLSQYATRAELNQLEAEIRGNYAKTSDLNAYATKAEVNQFGQEVNQLGQKINIPERERLLLTDCRVDNGYVRKTDGTIVNRNNYRVYTFSVEQYNCFFAELSAENDSYAISFVDENGNYIADSGVVGQTPLLTRGLFFYKADYIPSNAKYVRFSTYKDLDSKIWGERNGMELKDVLETLNSSTSFLSTEDYSNSANLYIRYSTLETVATKGSITYYYKNDGYEKVVAEIMCKTYNGLAIGFLDNNRDFITTKKYEALIGRNIYVVDVPDDAEYIVVSNVEKDNDFHVWIFKNVPKEINKIDTVFSNAVQKNRFENYDVLKGFIRKTGYENAGQLTPSGGARTLVYKNQGIKTIDVWATFPGTEGVAASFNVISLYTVDGWLSGQGYMSSDSVSAIYGSVRKHYKVNVPANCGLILITLNATSGVIDDNTAVIELNNGNKGNYLDDAHNISDMRFVLPSYYTESYVRNKINTIELRMKPHASNSDCFVWQTDEHFERSAGYSYGLIRKLCNKLNIPRLFSGGDTAHMGINMDMVKLRRKAFDGKIYQVIGNHEYLSYTFETDGATTEDDIFYGLENYYGNDVVFGNKQRHYYYVNNDVQKIRYIILNAFAQSDGVTNSAQPGYEQEQLNWLRDVALNVESGWSVIIFTHRLFEGSPINPANTYIPQSCQPVADIIENYSGNGKIIAVFQGHTHYDMIKYLSNGAIPVIITTCDNNGLYRYDDTLQEYVRDYDVERESGTIREHAFDVVTIDKTLKRISLVRIGCPARDWSEPEGELVEERIVYWQ